MPSQSHPDRQGRVTNGFAIRHSYRVRGRVSSCRSKDPFEERRGLRPAFDLSPQSLPEVSP